MHKFRYILDSLFLWKKNYREKGELGLINNSRRPYNNDFCKTNNLKTISESKIGRLIKKHNWYLYLGDRSRRKQVIRDKKRIFGYPVEEPGDLFQVDTIVRFEHGIKRYIITAIDVVSKFAFSFTYKNRSSRTTADFAAKLVRVTPYDIKAIQTDNGSEFLNDFDKVIHSKAIVHFFTYPRCPISLLQHQKAP
jgi:hypothetical protein